LIAGSLAGTVKINYGDKFLERVDQAALAAAVLIEFVYDRAADSATAALRLSLRFVFCHSNSSLHVFTGRLVWLIASPGGEFFFFLRDFRSFSTCG
jgi:hypothetical protein